MNNPDENKLNAHIRRAVEEIPSDHEEDIWNTPVDKAESDAWFLEDKSRKARNYRYVIRLAGAAAACLAIVILGWLGIWMSSDATVYLDVNPGISMDVNRLGRVVRAEAVNIDGQVILGDMYLCNTHIDVAMNALIGSMVRHGYISSLQNTVLISVNGKNEKRTTALRQRLAEDARQTLDTLLVNGIILGQNVDPDDDAEDISEEYGITPGKAALILSLLKDHPSWDVKDLASMPMAELVRYCRSSGTDISVYLGDYGEVIGDIDSISDDDADDEIDDTDDFETEDHDLEDSDSDDHDDIAGEDSDNDDDDDLEENNYYYYENYSDNQDDPSDISGEYDAENPEDDDRDEDDSIEPYEEDEENDEDDFEDYSDDPDTD